MSQRKCGIEECDGRLEDVKGMVVYQTVDHERHECRVCEAVILEDYFAIRHTFDGHTRAEFVRAYDANSSTVHIREDAKDVIEVNANLDSIVETLREWDAL